MVLEDEPDAIAVAQVIGQHPPSLILLEPRLLGPNGPVA
jgi:hypothetical protein